MRLFQILQTIIILNLLFIYFGAQTLQADEVAFQVKLRKGSLNLLIRYDSGKEDWANYIGQKAINYIPLVERYLNRRFPAFKEIIIQGCDNCGSRCDGKYIYLDYNEPGQAFNPSVIYHEIDHYWFYYLNTSKCQNWLMEGISSFLPVALQDKGLLPNDEISREEINRWWGLHWPLPADIPDRPLCPYDVSLKRLIYAKTFRQQYLFYYGLGERRYQRWVRQISAKFPRNNTEVLKLLTQISGKSWRSYLPGWVTNAKYSILSPSSFLIDSDADGLSDGQEYAHKTNANNPDSDGDGLVDGLEIKIHSNPKKANQDAGAINAAYGPYIDGSAGDWNYFPEASQVEDALGDSDLGPRGDMVKLHFLVRDPYLYVLVELGETPLEAEDLMFDILVDTNEDNHTDEEFAFRLNNPFYPWHYARSTTSSSSPLNLKAARGRYLEMAIPLSEIPTKSFRIWPIIYNLTEAKTYDSFGEWIIAN